MPMFLVTILTTNPGERITAKLPAETGAEAMARVLRWKRQREDPTITHAHAKRVGVDVDEAIRARERTRERLEGR